MEGEIKTLIFTLLITIHHVIVMIQNVKASLTNILYFAISTMVGCGHHDLRTTGSENRMVGMNSWKTGNRGTSRVT